MHDTIASDFAGLSLRAKIMVLARTIHRETIHVRDAHLDDPTDSEKLYQSIEFIHRLSGCIMSIATEGADTKCANYVAPLLIDGVKLRGAPYLRMLADWISEAETLR
jgi:hypothetical protein